jgi:hypothetical protein
MPKKQKAVKVEVGVYNLKTEFFPLIGVNQGTWTRRKQELLDHLEDYFDYEILKTRPLSIDIKEVYSDFQPLPRKGEKTKLEKQNDYEQYVLENFNSEWRLTSKAKESRDAIAAFGKKKYNHTSDRAVSDRYVGPAMEKYCEKDNKHVWVDYANYKPLEEDVLADWRSMLSKHKIGEAEAAKAFYRQAKGEDVSLEISYYENARTEFLEKYGIVPVLVSSWKKK